jgi:hypothetical protein
MIGLKTERSSHLTQMVIRLRKRDHNIMNDILVACYSQLRYLLHCSSSDWHEGHRYGYPCDLDFHCCGDQSYEEAAHIDT